MDHCRQGEVTRGVPMRGENEGGTGDQRPSAWVIRFLGGIRPGGRILDVACGSGRNLRAALGAGFQVTGVDRKLSGLADLSGVAGVELVEMDLETGVTTPLSEQFGTGTFDGVIVTNYLWRPIMKDVVAMVRGDGILIYETFGRGNEHYGKPSNPDFLLKPGELLDAISPVLTAIAFEHMTVGEPLRVVQRVAAVGPQHKWLDSPPRL